MRRRVYLLAVLVGTSTAACGGPRSPPVQEGADKSGIARLAPDTLVALADSLYQAGDYTGARAVWLEGLQRLRNGREVALEARILTSLGLAEWRLGDYPAARARVEQARSVLEADGPRSMLPRTLNALGLIAWDQGRLTEAAEVWQRTMEIAREVGDQEYVDKPAMNLGLYYSAVGDFEQAGRAFRASRLAGRRLGIPALELRSLVNLAMVANRVGEPEAALTWLDSAVAAGLEQDFLAEDMYRSQLALAAWSLGDPGVALAALDSAITRARAVGLRESEAANLTLMADVYWEAGDPVRALDLHTRAAAMHRELDLPAEEGQNLYSAARIDAALGHAAPAGDLASRALELHQMSEELVLEFGDHLLLAELGRSGHLAAARRIAAQLDTRAARARLALAEARTADRDRRPRDVLHALATIAHELEAGLSAEVSEAEALRARAYAGLAMWDSAVAVGERAVAAVELARGGYGSSLLGSSFASFRAGVYGNLVAAFLALGRDDEAFEVADAARGGRVYGAGGSPMEPGTEGLQGSRRELLLRRITALEQEILGMEQDGRDSREVEERLRAAQREYELQVLGGGKATGAAQSRVGAGTVREALAPDEAVLAYLVTSEALFVFTLARDRIRAEVVPVSGSELEARVRLARAMLADPSTSPTDAEDVLAALSRWLLPPAEALVGVRRLVIVPHGVLAYLPFGALLTPEGQYLVEQYSLAHLPYAAFLADRSSREPGTSLKVTALAPRPDELPGSDWEVSAIKRAYPGSRTLVGPSAREAALREALRSDAVTHVAGHAVLNRVNPLFSRIEVARGRGRSPEDDGRLEVHEILGLAIRSPLVFLSGCETGLGPGGSRRYTPGEDYATLAAAFLTAGARQVVATLWAIPDTGAAVFADRFYANLDRADASEALAAAQRALLANPRFRHPYYWAGYRLTGTEGRGPRRVPTT